ncbi:uncharacterized protein PITG_05403 [Phytophthora infestans T30-4]|uniref:Jacalin-type lectin domain-containing protein n=1 Tax=Phytophthora infestans (strain T30-4) TaxID=403677 RepID=D0N2Q9_PHYIT|nr:uncharacterized protein PITG_05403 [Phytophthora infestans T30-4]EEY69201.1 conserved hypothetical protein [Phytophthora infestans T30-4]|eukprot:XP_002999055.1 conserved hypothetical protein [Phytophthora infestans T30-4]
MWSNIIVDNLHEDEVLSYPLVLLEGRITDAHPAENLFLDARLDDLRSSLWPISRTGHFKAFVLLPFPGKYAITLQLNDIAHRIFCIEYRPHITRFVVKFHYQICSDAENRDGFDAPLGVDNSDAVAIAKIRFTALLLQMATAELMHAAGLPRLTFTMQFAPDGLPDVTLLRCRFTNTHARSVDGQELTKLVQQDIEASGLDSNPELHFKHAVVLGCSRYNRETRKAEGHTALGDPRSSQQSFQRSTAQGWLDLNHTVVCEVTSRGGAHWNSASAQLLRHCPWISGYAKPSLVGPTVDWGSSILGPVGYGTYNGTQTDLPEKKLSSSVDDQLGAVMLDAGKYIDHIETLTRAEMAEAERTEPLRAAGTKHWFMLADGEYISRVDIRAMAWIDGLQLHTNLRSSRWYGGTGGSLHALQPAGGWHVSSFIGSRGDSHVAGKALEGGTKTPFSITLPEIGAVVVQCGRFVERVKVLSPEEAESNSRDPKFYLSNEHVFQLCPGEKLIKSEE